MSTKLPDMYKEKSIITYEAFFELLGTGEFGREQVVQAQRALAGKEFTACEINLSQTSDNFGETDYVLSLFKMVQQQAVLSPDEFDELFRKAYLGNEQAADDTIAVLRLIIALIKPIYMKDASVLSFCDLFMNVFSCAVMFPDRCKKEYLSFADAVSIIRTSLAEQVQISLEHSFSCYAALCAKAKTDKTLHSIIQSGSHNLVFFSDEKYMRLFDRYNSGEDFAVAAKSLDEFFDLSSFRSWLSRRENHEAITGDMIELLHKQDCHYKQDLCYAKLIYGLDTVENCLSAINECNDDIEQVYGGYKDA